MTTGPQFDPTVPLGGTTPPNDGTTPKETRRDLILAGALLVLAVIAGASSLMPWRDEIWGHAIGFRETGWVRSDGSLGRGWVTVVYAMAVASDGILIAAGKARLGRVLAVLCGAALMVLATVEWGVGAGGGRTGPGLGLWIQLGTGALIVLAVGIVDPGPRMSREH